MTEKEDYISAQENMSIKPKKGGNGVRTIMFEDALEGNIVREGHYLVTVVPKDVHVIAKKNDTGYREDQDFKINAGSQKLWRLESGMKLWGEPTKEKLVLQGQQGFMRGIDAIHYVARELYVQTGLFEQIQSCSLQRRDYITTYEEKAWRDEKNNYKQPDDTILQYWLASRCILIDGIYADRYVFHVDSGRVNPSVMYYYSGNAVNDAYAVRSEATPSANLVLDVEDCDGTMSKPWKVLEKRKFNFV